MYERDIIVFILQALFKMEDKKRRYSYTAVKSWDNPAKAVRLESNI